jgi:hypothetical protein
MKSNNDKFGIMMNKMVLFWLDQKVKIDKNDYFTNLLIHFVDFNNFVRK